MPSRKNNHRILERTQKRAVQRSPEHKEATEHEILQHAVTSHSHMPGLQRTVGNRSVARLFSPQMPELDSRASNLVQRYEPPTPVEVTPTPVQQKPYYRIDEVLPDLHRIVAVLSERPPRYEAAKSMIENISRSVDSWFGDIANSKRIDRVFGTQPGRGKWVFDARNAIGEMYGVIHRAQYDAELRGETNPRPTLINQQIAVVEFAVPYIKQLENAVSYELKEAENLPDVPTKFTRLPRTEAHVLAWLVKYKSEIASAAAKFKVDRRAVAGAIAWEAIVQVKSSSFRAVGPGKPHTGAWESKDSAVEEVESRGYMPKVELDEREKILKTMVGSTLYIGALMGAFADISGHYGLNIRNDPGVLTTIYHAWRPSQWEERMKDKAATHIKGQPWPRPSVQNPMGIWVDEHLPYLEEAVGFTPTEKQALGEKSYTATGEGKISPIP